MLTSVLRKILLATSVVAMVAACTPNRADFDSDEAYMRALEERKAANQRIVSASRAIYAVYVSQIQMWRDAGVDISVVNAETQNYMRLACVTAVAVSAAVIELSVTDPGEIQDLQMMSAEALKWCQEIVNTLGGAPEPTA